MPGPVSNHATSVVHGFFESLLTRGEVRREDRNGQPGGQVQSGDVVSNECGRKTSQVKQRVSMNAGWPRGAGIQPGASSEHGNSRRVVGGGK